MHVEVASSEAGGRSPSGETRGSSDRGSVGAQAVSHALHSDGVVCRCAVHWRRAAIERGLAESAASSAGDAREVAAPERDA